MGLWDVIWSVLDFGGERSCRLGESSELKQSLSSVLSQVIPLHLALVSRATSELKLQGYENRNRRETRAVGSILFLWDPRL